MYVIGIDPGPIAGVVRLKLALSRPGENLVADGARLIEADALQVTPRLLTATLDMLTSGGRHRSAIAVERFVVGPRAARSSTPAAGATARNLVGVVSKWVVGTENVTLLARSAAEVKPWATDARLDAAGLLEPTKGMRHARDAARHALFCAVRDWGLPDPLSRRGRGV